MPSPAIEIQLNGSPRKVPDGTTVTALLADLNLDAPAVLVEHNGTALFPREFAATPLRDRDVVEVVCIAAGG